MIKSEEICEKCGTNSIFYVPTDNRYDMETAKELGKTLYMLWCKKCDRYIYGAVGMPRKK